MTDPNPEPCTNYGHTRRHYSTSLAPTPFGTPGREGKSLCRVGGMHTNVYDDEAINATLGPWRRNKPPIVVADLPECKACARELAKSEASRG